MSEARKQVEGLSVEILGKDFETLHKEWLQTLEANGYPSDQLELLKVFKTMHEYWFVTGQQHGASEVAEMVNDIFGA